MQAPNPAKTERLRKRSEFLALRNGRKFAGKAFSLQAARRDMAGPARFGFTVTRKVGNAVERNRIRRRLKEAVRLIGHDHALDGYDYVLVARRKALNLPFAVLTSELAKGLDRSGAEQPDRTRVRTH